MKELKDLEKALDDYSSKEGGKKFFEFLGYKAEEPVTLELELPEGVRNLVSKVLQVVYIKDSSSFRIFHVELAGSEIRRTDIRRFLEAYYRLFTEGENLFVFSPKGRDDELAFVSPRRLPDSGDPHKVRLWLRTLQVRREQLYRTDLEVLSRIRAEGARTAEEVWKRHEEAFSVQRVTEQFFRDYSEVFRRIRLALEKTHPSNSSKWARDYTHLLLNRLMFLYFIARKGWLLGPGGTPDRDFMRHFWEAYREAQREGRAKRDTFHCKWLPVLFFEAFNNQGQNLHGYRGQFPEWLIHAMAQAPFLNGGLYRRTELDTKLKKHLPDEFFELLFEKWTDGTFPGLFERYNFTVVETGRFDEEVAVDPEMLGMVYERLVNITFEAGDEVEDLRGTAGIFYTSRTEIDLMCRLALVDWLANHVGAQHKGLLYRWVFAFSEEEKQEADKAVTQAKLWECLKSWIECVRVCDPACGSGSFLVGMLLVLDDLQARCNHAPGMAETVYERRKRILQDQLYGVDVMEWAVRVAELRLWLQIVVETRLEEWELRRHPLLPNLTFKLRPGDSLLQTLGDYDLSPFRRREHPLPGDLEERIAEIKNKKQLFFLGEDIGLSEEALKKEEVDLFQDILKAKLKQLTAPTRLPGMEAERPEDEAQRRLEAEIRELEEQRKRIQDALRTLPSKSPSPFIWDLAFVEIFEAENPGFDIVIGNPPYVRQEKIRDYLERFSDRKEYLDRLNESLRTIYPAFMGTSRRISGRADYYIYFYLHALSLLADKGTFCFITSNSWLDVDFGKDLQEFFLRHGDLKMVIDNRARRSFAHADVNTVIVLAGPPERKRPLSEEEMKSRAVRFVAFRVPFEEALSPVVFSEIGDDALYQRMDHFQVLQRPGYRAVRLDYWTLWQEGLGEGDEGQLLEARRYEGNKWGGKYLRAPDIFFTILEKGKGKLVRLGEVAEVLTVSWSRQGENANLMYSKFIGKLTGKVTDVLKSPKDVAKIPLRKEDTVFWLKLEKWVERQLVYAPILWVDLRGAKHICHLCLEEVAFTHNFHGINPYECAITSVLCSLLNSTLVWLLIEVVGRRGLGGGAVRVLVKDLRESFPMLNPSTLTQHERLLSAFEQMCQREIKSVFEELGFTLCRTRRCEHPEHPYEHVQPETLTLPQVRQASPDRFELDAVVFDVLGLTEAERLEVYRAVVQLVKERLVKARSV